MSLGEILATALVAAALAGAAYEASQGRLARGRSTAEIEEVERIARDYRRGFCGSLPTTATPIATLAAALGRNVAARDAGEWAVVYRTGPAGTGSRRGGASMDLVLTSTDAARRQAVVSRGGRESGGVATLTVAPSGWREHRGRRAFAHLQGNATC